jgi:hypothetical protein
MKHRRVATTKLRKVTPQMLSTYSLSGATAVASEHIIRAGRVKNEQNRMRSLIGAAGVEFDLESGVHCYPAPINIHDQLRGDYRERDLQICYL